MIITVINYQHICSLLCHIITGGDDYSSGPYNVTLTAGTTNSSFAISISDDNTFEDNESFVLTITSLPNSTTAGDPRQATVTIVDDEGNVK